MTTQAVSTVTNCRIKSLLTRKSTVNTVFNKLEESMWVQCSQSTVIFGVPWKGPGYREAHTIRSFSSQNTVAQKQCSVLYNFLKIYWPVPFWSSTNVKICFKNLQVSHPTAPNHLVSFTPIVSPTLNIPRACQSASSWWKCRKTWTRPNDKDPSLWWMGEASGAAAPCLEWPREQRQQWSEMKSSFKFSLFAEWGDNSPCFQCCAI